MAVVAKVDVEGFRRLHVHGLSNVGEVGGSESGGGDEEGNVIRNVRSKLAKPKVHLSKFLLSPKLDAVRLVNDECAYSLRKLRVAEERSELLVEERHLR